MVGSNSEWTPPREPYRRQYHSGAWERPGDASTEDTAILPATQPRHRTPQPTASSRPQDAGAEETMILPASRPLPWRRILLEAIGVFLVTRLAYTVVTYFAVIFSISSVSHMNVPKVAFPYLIVWETGDVSNYVAIAVRGYTHDFMTAFFPLYPLLIHIFSLGHGGPVALAVAMIISNLGSLAALVGLGLLAAHEYGPSVSMPAIRALVAFPLAFFLVMGYADNLFLALVIFAFFFARRGAWGKVIACVFVSALLRPTGVTLILPLLWEYGRQQGWWAALWATLRRSQTPARASSRAPARSLAQRLQQFILYPMGLVVAAPAGIALFAAYCWSVFGNPLTFLQVQQSYYFRRPTSLPAALLYLAQTLFRFRLLSFLEARNLIDLAPLVIFIALTVFAIARRQLSVMYLLYLAGVFYADLAAPMIGRTVPFPSVGRHMLLAVPLFLLLGKWSSKRPWLDTLIISLGFMLQGVFLVAVMHGNLTIFNAID